METVISEILVRTVVQVYIVTTFVQNLAKELNLKKSVRINNLTQLEYQSTNIWRSKLLTKNWMQWECKKERKQAGAEMCQAQVKLGLVWFDLKLFMNGDLIRDRIKKLFHFMKTEVVFHFLKN